MVKILFDLQISSLDIDGKLLITSDSNYIFMKSMIEGLSKRGHECVILMPWDEQRIGDGYQSMPNAVLYYVDFHGIVQDRFFVDNYVKKVINKENPDILWTNDPCRVGQYRSVYDGIIIAYNHWIDSPDNPVIELKNSYFFRQIEAAWKADYIAFNSQTGYERYLGGLRLINGLKPPQAKPLIINPPLNTELIGSIAKIAIKNDYPTLIYNHRLSSAPQYANAISSLERILDRLHVPGLKIIITNPSGKAHPILNHPKVINSVTNSYEEYLTHISKGWVHLTLFDYPGQWSMSMGEGLSLGLRCIFPKFAGYAEMTKEWFFPKENEYVTTMGAVTNIKRLLDFGPYAQEEQGKFFRNKFSIDNIVEKFIKDVNIGSI